MWLNVVDQDTQTLISNDFKVNVKRQKWRSGSTWIFYSHSSVRHADVLTPAALQRHSGTWIFLNAFHHLWLFFQRGLVGSAASSLGLQRKRSCDGRIAFSFFVLSLPRELTTPNKVQPRSNGLTFPMLKVSSPSCFSIFLASSSSSAISMLSLDQMISVSALTFPICGGKQH